MKKRFKMVWMVLMVLLCTLVSFSSFAKEKETEHSSKHFYLSQLFAATYETVDNVLFSADNLEVFDSPTIKHNPKLVFTMNCPEDIDTNLIPYLSLDDSNNTFVFFYDSLSSFLPIGTYEVKDHLLTATTTDGTSHYTFEIVDNNTLVLIQDASSDVSLIDSNIGVTLQDQAKFQAEDHASGMTVMCEQSNQRINQELFISEKNEPAKEMDVPYIPAQKNTVSDDTVSNMNKNNKTICEMDHEWCYDIASSESYRIQKEMYYLQAARHYDTSTYYLEFEFDTG